MFSFRIKLIPKYLLLIFFIGIILSFLLHKSFEATSTIVLRTNSENIEFPKGSVVDVVSEYDVVPNDGLDDTVGIQKALNDYADQNRIIYLKNGIYDISDTLVFTGNQRFNTLQGQSEAGTVIRLKNKSPQFAAGVSERKPLLNIPPGSSADRFQNEIYNITFDVGSNNPMADGLWFISNNQGGMRNITIKSDSNHQGIGLSLASGLNGPMLAKNVTIKGFYIGIRTENAVNSQTFENIHLLNQGFTGIYNSQQMITIRKLFSQQRLPIPALINGDDPGIASHWFGLVTIVDSTLKYTGKSAAPFAIQIVGNAYGKNVSIQGYDNAAKMDYAYFRSGLVENELLSLEGVGISEWTKSYRENSRTNLVTRLFEKGIKSSLSLEVEDTPDVPWDNPSQWVSVADFAVGDGESDETTAFQAAVNSMKAGGLNEGKTTLYIPGGMKFRLDGIVEISGPVRRIIGLKGILRGTSNDLTTGGFRIVDSGETDAPLVRFERLSGFASNFLLEHQSNRAVAIVNTTGIKIDSSSSGNLYLEDVVMRFSHFRNPKQRIWARQLNTEGRGTKITNGSILWILGIKTEKYGTVIDTLSKGFTEVIGGLIYRVDQTKVDTSPMFSVTNAHATFAGIGEMDGSISRERNYSTITLETRGKKKLKGERDLFYSGRHNDSRILFLHISATKYSPIIN